MLVARGTNTEQIDFLGKSITVRGDAGSADLVVINGDQQAPVVTFSTGETLTATLENLTVFNGGGEGSGIRIEKASPTIRLVRIIGNSGGRGGGAAVLNSFAVFEQCSFINNEADPQDGGAVYIAGGAQPSFINWGFSGNRANHAGGAVRIYDGNPLFRDCIFQSNSSCFFGGTLAGRDGGRVKNCQFQDNRARAFGGALTLFRSLVVVGCEFAENQASDGGALRITGITRGTVSDCVFPDNTATGRGGAILLDGSLQPARIENCTFRRNIANRGGAIAQSIENSTRVMLIGCQLITNAASRSGGPCDLSHANGNVINCLFNRNVSAQDAGALQVPLYVNVVGSLFVGNVAARYGGAGKTIGSYIQLTGCTMYGNAALADGGAVYHDGSPDVSITNCLLWSNAPDPIATEATEGLIVRDCDIQGGYPGEGNFSSEPLLVDPAGPDGFLGTSDDDLRPAAGAPLIDAGDPNALPPDELDLDGDGDMTEPIPIDFAGNPRLVDDPATPDRCTGDLNHNGVVDAADLSVLLMNFGTPAGATGADGDLDGDGDVDLGDLGRPISAFGACPPGPRPDIGAYEFQPAP